MVVWLSFILVINLSTTVFASMHHLLLPELDVSPKISVAVSEQKPFVILDPNGGSPKGLDVLIVENFAKKFNFKIDYYILNASLNYIFVDKKHLNRFPVETILKCVFVIKLRANHVFYLTFPTLFLKEN